MFPRLAGVSSRDLSLVLLSRGLFDCRRCILRHRNSNSKKGSLAIRVDGQFAVELAGTLAHAPDSKACASRLNVRELLGGDSLAFIAYFDKNLFRRAEDLDHG